MKKILSVMVVLILLLAVAIPSGIAIASPGPQIWQLDSESPITGYYQMERTGSPGDDGQTGNVAIGNGSTQTWLSDEAAGAVVTFTGGAWVLELATDTDWGTLGSLASFEVGKYDGTTLTPFTTYQLVTTSWAAGNEVILQVRVDTATESIPVGSYLYVTITNSDAVAHTIYTNEMGDASCLRSPQTLPGFPLPELAAGILLGGGLIGLVTFVAIRHRRLETKTL